MSLTILALAFAVAGSPDAVAIATAVGGIRIDGLAVAGTGSVANGSRVETEARPARLTLRSGATVDMGSQSRIRVYDDRLFLEAGSSTVRGRMNVLNSEGILVARTAADVPVAFHAPPAPSATAELSGVIELKDGVLVIHDEASRLSFPLEAAGPEAEELTQTIGKKATVRGELRSGKVHVTSVEPISAAAATGTATTAATTVAAETTATAAGATVAGAAGISKAVIAGVAIAGAGATGATVGFVQSQSQPASTVSQ